MFWKDTAEEVYLRHAMKIRRDRLTQAGWEIDLEDLADHEISLVVEDPDGDIFCILYLNAAHCLRRLWEIEWDFMTKPQKLSRSYIEPVLSRSTVMGPLNAHTYLQYKNIFTG